MRRALVLVPAALCALLLAAADPRGDFPLNDDFQYAESVFGLRRGEGLRLSEWAYASQVTHILMGAPAAALLGATDWSLRLWNMALGCAAAGAVTALAMGFGAFPGAALLAGAVIACGPLHLVMSASFHLEVTLAVCVLAALWGLRRHLRSGDLAPLAGASAALGLAALTRQNAALAVAGLAAAASLRRRLDARRAAALLLPLAALCAAWWLWSRFVHGPTWALLALAPEWPARWSYLPRRASDVIQTAGLFLSPIALAALPSVLRLPRPGRAEAAALAALSLAAADGWAARGMPVMVNTLTRRGLGVVTLTAPEAKEAGWWGHPALWVMAAAAAFLSSLVLARLLWPRAGEPEGAPLARRLLAAAALPVLATGLLGPNYDRYLTAWLPPAALAVVLAAGPRLAPAWGLAACLAMGAVSSAGLRDYFAWNRARWEAGLIAVARGAPPGKVENGFDWDARHTFRENMARLRRERAPSGIGMWDWMTLNRVVAITSFSAAPPKDGFVLVDSVPYRTPFARGERRVYLWGLR